MAFRYRAGQAPPKVEKIKKIKETEKVTETEIIAETIESEDAQVEERKQLLARLRAQAEVIAKPEVQLVIDEPPESPVDESSSSSIESSDEDHVPLVRPVFIPKASRSTVQPTLISSNVGSNWRAQALESLAVVNSASEEKEVVSGLGDWAVPLPTNKVTEASEEDVDALRTRELQRVLASRLDELRVEADKADKERRSKMTDEEIMRENPERFLRSTETHSGAFFQDFKRRKI